MSCCLLREVEIGVEGLGGNRVLLISVLFSFLITTLTSPSSG